MRQAEVFQKGEGNAWFKRNYKKLPIQADHVVSALAQLVGPVGSSVLEIGCSNGWRLKEIERRWKCQNLSGIDPSEKAIELAKKQGIDAVQGFAHCLPFMTHQFDLVIYGFCLCLCDRDWLFMITAEGDRVLKDGGLMVVHDFDTTHPCKREYKHKEGVWKYKQAYDDMFLANPAYTRLVNQRSRDGIIRTSVMKKKIDAGWPECT